MRPDRCLQRPTTSSTVDFVAAPANQHHHGDGDDGEAQQHPNAIPADLVLDKNAPRRATT